eukprot:CAMPEP_0183363704 /NCGR_PEP_ID=MMETSP0164_2-20130417/76451_1 /TAXON_ID=221442 /ORGANISM="Coccolithus pelagicus ssp braarudi, Strain PLY182g" /LENGTH=64 /DNA_ID=CAMNT_0025538861 /DNA_START=79 /DNA_END=269 /DNA_ORIENTATION=+
MLSEQASENAAIRSQLSSQGARLVQLQGDAEMRIEGTVDTQGRALSSPAAATAARMAESVLVPP